MVQMVKILRKKFNENMILFSEQLSQCLKLEETIKDIINSDEYSCSPYQKFIDYYQQIIISSLSMWFEKYNLAEEIIWFSFYDINCWDLELIDKESEHTFFYHNQDRVKLNSVQIKSLIECKNNKDYNYLFNLLVELCGLR